MENKTERERLTERIGDGVRYYDGKYLQTCYPKNNNLRPVDKLAVKLCEFEDKIENGALLELPCKVVWITGEVKGVYSSKVRTFFLTENGVEMIRTQHCDIPFEDVGKKAFVGEGAKEEAEKALERSREK